MRICLVFYDMQDFGGLEEYAATLAIGLRKLGHQTSVLSAAWVPPGNQYRRRLRANGVPFVQVPKVLSHPASHWQTKVRILQVLMVAASPVVLAAGLALWIARRGSFKQALLSAHGRLRGELLSRLVAPDRRRPLARLLLNGWRLWWRPQVLHIQGYTSNLLFAIDWAHEKGVPVVYEEHQTPDARFDWWRDFGRSINKAATVVAVSRTSAEALRDVCGVTRPIVVRAPLLPDPVDSGWRSRLPPRPAGRDVIVTTVARLYVTKGLEYLLEAVAQVTTTHPRTRFRVFGDGPLRDELLENARRLDLDGEAIFPGAFTSRAALTDLMAETDIFLMSSVLEGQPLGVVEAMAYGCPIVATTVGGIPELIADGVNGLLCPPRDPSCLASRVRTLIEDPALRERLGREARRSYEQGGFQPASVCAHFEQIYGDVLGQLATRPTA